MKNLTKYSLATFLLAPTLVSANAMTGTGELGFSNNTGNTENTALYASLKLGYVTDGYEFKSLIESNYKSENGEKTEERYLIDLQNNFFYNQSKSYYSYIGLRFEKNRFEDINLDTTVSAGMGKVLYKTDISKLNGEIGLGHQNTDYVSKNTDSESQTVAIGKLAYTHQFNDNVGFLQDLTVTSGPERKKYETNTAFKVKVAAKANLKISYKVRHNDNPAEGAEKTDTQTLMTLTYDF